MKDDKTCVATGDRVFVGGVGDMKVHQYSVGNSGAVTHRMEETIGEERKNNPVEDERISCAGEIDDSDDDNEKDVEVIHERRGTRKAKSGDEMDMDDKGDSDANEDDGSETYFFEDSEVFGANCEGQNEGFDAGDQERLDDSLLLTRDATDSLCCVSMHPKFHLFPHVVFGGCDETCRIYSCHQLFTVEPSPGIGKASKHVGRIDSGGLNADNREMVSRNTADCSNKQIDISSKIHNDSLISSLGEFSETVSSSAFSMDGKFLAVGSLEGIVKVYRLNANLEKSKSFGEHGREKKMRDIREVEVNHADETDEAACRRRSSTDISYIGKERNTCYIFTSVLEGPSGEIEWLCWHPKGHCLLAGSSDSTIWMWWATSGVAMQVFTGHKGRVTCGGFGMRGKVVCSGGDDGACILWCPRTGNVLFRFDGIRKQSGTGCIGEENGDVIQDGSGGKRSTSHQDKNKMGKVSLSPVISLDTHQILPLLACGMECGGVALLSIETKKRLAILGGHDLSVETLAFTPPGTSLASALQTPSMHPSTPQEATTSSVSSASSKDAGYVFLASGGLDGRVCVWDCKNLSMRFKMMHSEGEKDDKGVQGISNDGGVVSLKWINKKGDSALDTANDESGLSEFLSSFWLLSTGTDGMIKLFDCVYGTCLKKLSGNDGPILGVHALVCPIPSSFALSSSESSTRNATFTKMMSSALSRNGEPVDDDEKISSPGSMDKVEVKGKGDGERTMLLIATAGDDSIGRVFRLFL